jgi:hypothetical protein
MATSHPWTRVQRQNVQAIRQAGVRPHGVRTGWRSCGGTAARHDGGRLRASRTPQSRESREPPPCVARSRIPPRVATSLAAHMNPACRYHAEAQAPAGPATAPHLHGQRKRRRSRATPPARRKRHSAQRAARREQGLVEESRLWRSPACTRAPMHGTREEAGEPPYELGAMLVCLTRVAWRAIGSAGRVPCGALPVRVAGRRATAMPFE